jgi:uncharacterized membrane protein
MNNAQENKSFRLPEIDRLRGFVMVLMALDHMRDFLDADALRFSATDITHTYPALFFTRLITHLCAPTFAILAGIGAWVYGSRINDPSALSRFLLSRGFWLIGLDVFLVSPVFAGGVGTIELGTLWAIGSGLISLALLSRLRAEQVLLFGLAIILGHNMLDGIHAVDLGAFGPWWRLVHEKGPLPLGLPGKVIYPALPWIGVVALGYGLGPLFQRPKPVRQSIVRVSGYISILLFIFLRALNIYGDPAPWTHQSSIVYSCLSFLNVSKYPPSLQYLLLTLGCSALIMGLLGGIKGGAKGYLADALSVFGRTPLFFYILHLYLGVSAGIAIATLKGFRFEQISGFIATGSVPENFGVGLVGTYVGWIVIVLVLFPICRWFDRLKTRRKDVWILRYL